VIDPKLRVKDDRSSFHPLARRYYLFMIMLYCIIIMYMYVIGIKVYKRRVLKHNNKMCNNNITRIACALRNKVMSAAARIYYIILCRTKGLIENKTIIFVLSSTATPPSSRCKVIIFPLYASGQSSLCRSPTSRSRRSSANGYIMLLSGQELWEVSFLRKSKGPSSEKGNRTTLFDVRPYNKIYNILYMVRTYSDHYYVYSP